MGKPKKSVVWEFLEQRADGKGFVSSCYLCTFKVRIYHQAHLYRIKIADNETRRNIIINTKKLKDNSNYKNTSLSRDLTFLQKQELRA